MWLDWLKNFSGRIYGSLVHLDMVGFKESRVYYAPKQEKFYTSARNAWKWNVKAWPYRDEPPLSHKDVLGQVRNLRRVTNGVANEIISLN